MRTYEKLYGQPWRFDARRDELEWARGAPDLPVLVGRAITLGR